MNTSFLFIKTKKLWTTILHLTLSQKFLKTDVTQFSYWVLRSLVRHPPGLSDVHLFMKLCYLHNQYDLSHV